MSSITRQAPVPRATERSMRHTGEYPTCPTLDQPGNYHFEGYCEDCDVRRLHRATLGQVETLYRDGRCTAAQFCAYTYSWATGAFRFGNYDAYRAVPTDPDARRIARKLLRAAGRQIPAELQLCPTPALLTSPDPAPATDQPNPPSPPAPSPAPAPPTAAAHAAGAPRPATSPQPRQGGTVSHPVINQAVEAMGHIGGYEFEHLSDIRAFSQSAPELLNSLAEAFSSLATNLGETPAHASVADLYGQMASGLASLADAAGEIAPTLEAGNADDFARIENPRPNEQMADYSVNAG